jgi:hypothetical protein
MAAAASKYLVGFGAGAGLAGAIGVIFFSIQRRRSVTRSAEAPAN